MAEEKPHAADKTHFTLLSIVAIVAIVGLVVLMKQPSAVKTSTTDIPELTDQEIDNLVGEARGGGAYAGFNYRCNCASDLSSCAITMEDTEFDRKVTFKTRSSRQIDRLCVETGAVFG